MRTVCFRLCDMNDNIIEICNRQAVDIECNNQAFIKHRGNQSRLVQR